MYRRCENCGANLDPYEICDCIKEAAPDVQDPKAAGEKIIFSNSITDRNNVVKED